MGEIKHFEVDNVRYNYAQCNARTQRTILFRLAKHGLSGLLEQTIKDDSIAQIFVAGIFAKMPEAEFEQMCDWLLAKTYRAGDESPITLDSFGGKMPTYLRVVFEVLKGNFEDFSGFLGSVNSGEAGQEV
jgi:hypothetical protein